MPTGRTRLAALVLVSERPARSVTSPAGGARRGRSTPPTAPASRAPDPPSPASTALAPDAPPPSDALPGSTRARSNHRPVVLPRRCATPSAPATDPSHPSSRGSERADPPPRQTPPPQRSQRPRADRRPCPSRPDRPRQLLLDAAPRRGEPAPPSLPQAVPPTDASTPPDP